MIFVAALAVACFCTPCSICSSAITWDVLSEWCVERIGCPNRPYLWPSSHTRRWIGPGGEVKDGLIFPRRQVLALRGAGSGSGLRVKRIVCGFACSPCVCDRVPDAGCIDRRR